MYLQFAGIVIAIFVIALLVGSHPRAGRRGTK